MLTSFLEKIRRDKKVSSTVEGVINEKKHIDGIIVETGCALGGSAIALASAKNRDRKFYVYDVFSKIRRITISFC